MLLVLCAWLAVPFLPAITWGVALAVIAWPLHTWVIRRVTEHRTFAAALTSLVVALAVVVPGVFVAYQLLSEVESAGDRGPRAAGRRLDPGSPGRHSANGSGCRLGRPGRRGYR